LAPVALVWAQVPKSRRSRISIDALRQTAAPEIGTARVVGLVAEAALAWGWLDAGSIFAALQLPQIVEASVKRALKPDGIIDRRLQLEHSGFLPEVGRSDAQAMASA
jgi:hypothetical protein